MFRGSENSAKGLVEQARTAKVYKEEKEKNACPPLLRVVTKIFVFVISRKFREILISCFAKFSSSFAKFSRNTKSKFGRNFRDFAKFFDEIFVISRNINQFLLKFNKILIITPYLVDWICRLCLNTVLFASPVCPPPSLFLTVLSSSFYFFLSVFSSSFSLSPLLISVLHFFFSFSSLCFCLSLFGQCLNVLSYSLCHLYLSIFLLSRLSLSSLNI